ncbi:hypothetical protein F5884DRAFT_897231 [Xylogone sp. PMI_703]|nr:hypothetical protein F5884DRAFT_897231 [Xylogone sp. PMI_703]
MYSKAQRYLPLPVGEFGEVSKKFQYRKSDIVACIHKLYSIIISVLAISLIILLVRSHRSQSRLPCGLLPSEIPFAQDAVHYREVTFDPSGFWEDPLMSTPYEGEPSPETDAMWKRLTNVGMYSLTKEEYDQLPLETTEVPGQPGQYLVTIEVFHQLHCLNYIRKAAYGVYQDIESRHSREMHLTHCVDYLRQVLMCHSDLSLITLRRDDDRLPPVMPDFRIRHTCRNFESVWEFAAKRNLSGITVE